jgi:hypothetical protein
LALDAFLRTVPFVKLRALQIALAGCLLWLLLLPLGMGQPDSFRVSAQVLGQVLLDDGLADDQPDFAATEDVFTRINERKDFSANLELGSFAITLMGDLAGSAGCRRLSQSERRDSDPSDFLLHKTRSPRAPPA